MPDDDQSFDELEVPALADGWDAEDVAMLKAMAGFCMDLAQSLAHEAKLHVLAVESGKVEALTPAEMAQASLGMSRVSRSLRLTLSLKAHAKGARGAAPSRTEPPAPTYLSLGPSPEERPAVRAEAAAKVRLAMEHAITDPQHDPAEVERLREGLELAIEREIERESFDLGFNNDVLGRVAGELGLDGPWRLAHYADGRIAGLWLIGRHDDEPTVMEHTWPDPPPTHEQFMERWVKPAPTRDPDDDEPP